MHVSGSAGGAECQEYAQSCGTAFWFPYWKSGGVPVVSICPSYHKSLLQVKKRLRLRFFLSLRISIYNIHVDTGPKNAT